MTSTTPATSASFLARSKKAIAGGVASAVTAGGSAIGIAFSDGTFSESDAWTVAGVIVGGFVIGFAAVWNAPKNAS